MLLLSRPIHAHNIVPHKQAAYPGFYCKQTLLSDANYIRSHPTMHRISQQTKPWTKANPMALGAAHPLVVARYLSIKPVIRTIYCTNFALEGGCPLNPTSETTGWSISIRWHSGI